MFDGYRSKAYSCGYMDTNPSTYLEAAGVPVLVSTGVTILYFLLKLLYYLMNATPRKTEGKERQTAVCKEGYKEQGQACRRSSSIKIPGSNQGDFSEGSNGPEWQPAPGAVLLQCGWESILLPTC